MPKFISASLLSANFLKLGKDIEMLNSHTDWFHIDVMDGVFVPNISYGFPVIRYIKQAAKNPLDVHLMIVDPDRYLEEAKNVGADIITVHYEACTHLHRTLSKIRSLGVKAGVALNPHTPVVLLEDIAEEIDLLLVMSVNPGFGGQKFIEHSYNKVRQAKELFSKKQPNALIEVDGGIGTQNAAKLYEAGADVLVSGASIFSSADSVETIALMKA
ncbi:MAG: ribulose-phosphate 3-epimerase [Prevotellaceae bacterium]|jgi:ribulose-phosphate 3-epimerase|nr:ribulose-phosphate 3-epimerase [Prevotellaceae bacterium]